MTDRTFKTTPGDISGDVQLASTGLNLMDSFELQLAAAKEGERWGFDALFNSWNQPITAFVTARGATDVDDVVNEIFLGAFQSLHSFRGTEAAFRSWIYRIARNKIADHFRKLGRTVATAPLEHARFVVAGDVEDDADAKLGLTRMFELLEHLTDEQREVLVLRFVADLTIDQIADVLGRRRGAVKQLQRRGLRRLERLLEGPDAQIVDLILDDPYPSGNGER